MDYSAPATSEGQSPKTNLAAAELVKIAWGHFGELLVLHCHTVPMWPLVAGERGPWGKGTPDES